MAFKGKVGGQIRDGMENRKKCNFMLKCKKEKNRQNVGFIFCVAKTLATESGKAVIHVQCYSV